ncbi:DNA helicase RecQ [Paenibacillus cymbidii]|uniref:DNA helicase RecQ n=1 Tax=Paenibacillus cymbidii TaxID=1639034 RepID=UPI0010815713|nr:DNA helicase RecQ [Paenibacillus cymbidii]
MLAEAQQLLQTYYGYPAFREGQRGIIERILEGQDVLGIMPTGGGKSICYQIPALLMPGVTLVISPLISLMKDQIDTLESMGIAAAAVNSSLTYAQTEQRLQDAARGRIKLLYIAPERLESERFQALLRRLNLSMVAIDEAHCISQWGHDFRPSYRLIAELIEQLPNRPQVTAFTATATPEVTDDIVDFLGIERRNVFLSGFDRANLFFNVVKNTDKTGYLLDYIRTHGDQSGIVYAATRKEVDGICQTLLQNGIAAGKYHAGLTDEERNGAQERFLYDDVQVMVASNAFGMGIDKSNVRYVIHYNMPKNMEAYYQEAGRAGRDGEASECILLYSAQDIVIQKFLIEQGTSAPERKSAEFKKLQGMIDYCHTPRCQRAYILRYFGETDPPASCGNCGYCCDDSELVDVSTEAQKVLSCVMRMRERFGVTLVTQVLRGAKSQRVQELGFDGLPTYGLLRDYSDKRVADLINALIADGYLTLTEGQYPVVKLLPAAGAVLKGTERVWQKASREEEANRAGARGKRGKSRFGGAYGANPVGAGTGDEALFERLRELRKAISGKERVPPYVVFPDSALREMSEYKPQSRGDMLRIKGVGETKCDKYGEAFIDAIVAYVRK